MSPTLVVFGDSLSDNGNLFNLIGIPDLPAWEGRVSNGPVYVEQLASFLGMRLDDRAFAGAEASPDTSPPLTINPSTGGPFPPNLPINLSNQLAGYLADLNGQKAPDGTTALINIGSNDYEAFLKYSLPPQEIQTFVANVVGSIDQAITTLTNAGVEHIILFTLPDLGTTPFAQALGPAVVAFFHELDLINNAALEQMAKTAGSTDPALRVGAAPLP